MKNKLDEVERRIDLISKRVNEIDIEVKKLVVKIGLLYQDLEKLLTKQNI